MASAASFAAGAALPLIGGDVGSAALSHAGHRGRASLLCLLFLGGWSAKVGGADVRTGALRVAFWSALAMGVTMLVGTIAGAIG
jgi:VIT1/CCC1 family predicted Fe2+/Mn2+ transporter